MKSIDVLTLLLIGMLFTKRTGRDFSTLYKVKPNMSQLFRKESTSIIRQFPQTFPSFGKFPSRVLKMEQSL